MNKLILTLNAILFASTAWAQTVHEEVFTDVAAGSGTQFWVRAYNWSAWNGTDAQSVLRLSSNPIKKAYQIFGPAAEDMDYIDRLSYEDFEAIFPNNEDEVDALDEFYEDSGEIEMDDVINSASRGLVVSSKMQIDLPRDYSIDAVSLDQVASAVKTSDAPHIYKEVDATWAHKFLDPVHFGHQEIQKHPNAKIFFTVINTSDEYYRCSSLNSALVFYSEGASLSVFGGAYRSYLINLIDEVPSKDFSKYSDLVEGKPSKIFIQKIVYASNLLKSGVNLIAFYDEGGQKKMITYSALVATDKVLKLNKVLSTFINGMNGSGDVAMTDAGVGYLNSSNLSLRPYSEGESCEVGLGVGVASYIYNLGLRVVDQSND